jgi:hypothetical protein
LTPLFLPSSQIAIAAPISKGEVTEVVLWLEWELTMMVFHPSDAYVVAQWLSEGETVTYE